MENKWEYKNHTCRVVKKKDTGEFALYVDGDRIRENFLFVDRETAEDKIEEHVDTLFLTDKLNELLHRSEHFKKNNDERWEVNERWRVSDELAETYDGSSINQEGKNYTYYVRDGVIQEGIHAEAPYKGGKSMWLQGEQFENIDEFRAYLKESYGIEI